MGVYIPTMKMPRDCLDCDLFIDKWEDWAYCAIRVNGDTCPLIEIPTPHGRLIDVSNIPRLGNTQFGAIFEAPTVIEAEE